MAPGVHFPDCAEEKMDRITSRKNAYVLLLRALASDAALRAGRSEFVCDGLKLLDEAVAAGAEITSILWKEGGAPRSPAHEALCGKQFLAPQELFDYASPMKNSPGPLFTARLRGAVRGPAPENGSSLAAQGAAPDERVENALILENVQDPGNVGTVLRTANAFSIGAVVLIGDCADLFSPKTVRSTMGAIVRQKVCRMGLDELPDWLRRNGLNLYGAALREDAEELQKLDITHSAVAVGSEGRGLSAELLALCEKKIIIPMAPESESLNAAVAASVLMWEMRRGR